MNTNRESSSPQLKVVAQTVAAAAQHIISLAFSKPYQQAFQSNGLPCCIDHTLSCIAFSAVGQVLVVAACKTGRGGTVSTAAAAFGAASHRVLFRQQWRQWPTGSWSARSDDPTAAAEAPQLTVSALLAASQLLDSKQLPDAAITVQLARTRSTVFAKSVTGSCYPCTCQLLQRCLCTGTRAYLVGQLSSLLS